LENEKGRRVLYVYFICLVATTIVAGVFSYMAFNDYLLSEGFEELMNSSSGTSSSITQLASYIQWVGPSAIISLIGAMVSNALLLFALYIPYKRITSGELVPLSPTTAGSSASDRRCPNCGQSIPFDANICPYCSKRFDDYL